MRLTNEFTTPFGIGRPANVSQCMVFLTAVDAHGIAIPGSEVDLAPGQEVDWYYAPDGAQSIDASCDNTCFEDAELEYDLPAS